MYSNWSQQFAILWYSKCFGRRCMAIKNAVHKQLFDLIHEHKQSLDISFESLIHDFQWCWINLGLMNARTLLFFMCLIQWLLIFLGWKKIEALVVSSILFYKFEARWRKTCRPHDLCMSAGECELVDCCKNLLKHQIAINSTKKKIASARANAQITETKKVILVMRMPHTHTQ